MKLGYSQNRSVIRLKLVFGILYGYSVFFAISFKVIDAQYPKFLIIGFFLFMHSLMRVFFIFSILVYSWSIGKYAAHQGILLQTLHRVQLHAPQIKK